MKGNEEPKLTTLTALILTYYMVFHKVLYKTHYFSVFKFVICFTILIIAVLPAMLTTTHHTPVTTKARVNYQQLAKPSFLQQNYSR